MMYTHGYVHVCSCGDVHPVHWNTDAGIDGAYVVNCPCKGRFVLSGCKGEQPGNSKELNEEKLFSVLA